MPRTFTTIEELEKRLFLDPAQRGVEPSEGQIGHVRMFRRSVSEAARTIEFVCSTGTVDRYGEIVEPDAFRGSLADFMRNPAMRALWRKRTSPVSPRKPRKMIRIIRPIRMAATIRAVTMNSRAHWPTPLRRSASSRRQADPETKTPAGVNRPPASPTLNQLTNQPTNGELIWQMN